MGCWTPVEYFDPSVEAGWHAETATPDGHAFDVICQGERMGRVDWSLIGLHNMANALAALAAARHAGVPAAQAIGSLAAFKNVKRRMELRGEVKGVRVYDDFAHHPTAIAATLDGLRRQVGDGRILALLEPRSNTMKRGVHSHLLAKALDAADLALLFVPEDLSWDPAVALAPLGNRLELFRNTGELIRRVVDLAAPGDHLLVMSNGGFEGIHQRLLDALASMDK
jgi:UDP-N-acetylmuramate: L-alanyl-gamma-D-glutamyl-meso-diaminopimelate ligase